MDTVTKEAARGRRRRDGLARRGLRESAGQRKAGRRGRRPSAQHARLAGHVELRRSRRVCRATEARRLTNIRPPARCSEPGSINPTTRAARRGQGVTVSKRAPVSAHARGFDIDPRPTPTVAGMDQGGSSTAHLTGRLVGRRGLAGGARPTPRTPPLSDPHHRSAHISISSAVGSVSRHAIGRDDWLRWKTPFPPPVAYPILQQEP